MICIGKSGLRAANQKKSKVSGRVLKRGAKGLAVALIVFCIMMHQCHEMTRIAERYKKHDDQDFEKPHDTEPKRDKNDDDIDPNKPLPAHYKELSFSEKIERLYAGKTIYIADDENNLGDTEGECVN